MPPELNNLEFVRALLVCPQCKGEVAFSSHAVSCTTCGASYPIVRGGVPILRPEGFGSADWRQRQQEMLHWYEEFIADPGTAVAQSRVDYDAISRWMAGTNGVVLGIGDGVGLSAHYLAAAAHYVVIDPSLYWLEPQWDRFRREFPSAGAPPAFISGVGEMLPFAAGAFDAVLAPWALNHVENPRQVCREIARVLRPRGHVLIVLEDVEPTWTDVVELYGGVRNSVSAAWRKLRVQFGRAEWLLGSDHLRIRESELCDWLSPECRLAERRWVGKYLAVVFVTRS